MATSSNRIKGRVRDFLAPNLILTLYLIGREWEKAGVGVLGGTRRAIGGGVGNLQPIQGQP